MELVRSYIKLVLDVVTDKVQLIKPYHLREHVALFVLVIEIEYLQLNVKVNFPSSYRLLSLFVKSKTKLL